MELNIDESLAPNLRLLLALSSPQNTSIGRRRIRVFDTPAEIASEIGGLAIGELANPDVADAILPDQFVALVRLAWRTGSVPESQEQPFIAPLRDLLKRHWSRLGREIIFHALRLDSGRILFQALPELSQSREFVDVLAEVDDRDLVVLEHHVDFDAVPPPTTMQLRRVLRSLDGSYGRQFRLLLMQAAARGQGWTPWLKLFGILWHFPELASDTAPAFPSGLDPYSSQEVRTLESAVWSALHGDEAARRVARLVRDLDGALATSPADLREVYVNRLRSAVGDNALLRQAAIEALLWTGEHGSRQIAIFAATHLASPDDLASLRDLTEAPERRVQYSAGLVLSVLEGSSFDTALGPPVTQVTPEATQPYAPAVGEPPRTWLGNRLLERMIETTVSALEQQVAGQYASHHGSGEERLGERFFAILGDRLQTLEGALRETALALGDAPKASVLVRYRPVDKTEEGREGVNRSGGLGPGPKFAADFCLVVNAYLDGDLLTRRAVLIQAKRLYPVDTQNPARGWVHSFRLDAVQTRSLLNQTASSFYLFQGPAELHLGLGIIPAQLVEDLAQQQNASGGAISSRSVSHVSETFAEWFTYQLVALRIGDPLQALIEKAERGPGSEPYPLLRCGTVEIDVRVGEPAKEG